MAQDFEMHQIFGQSPPAAAALLPAGELRGIRPYKSMFLRAASNLQISLLQAMKLVVFCAAAFSCVAPFVRPWILGEETGMFVVTYAAVAVPLMWTALSFILVHRGRWRDRLILWLLLCSVSAALAAAAWFLYLIIRQIRLNGNLPGVVRQVMIRELSFVGLVSLALAAALLFLVTRLVRQFASSRETRA